MKHRCSSCCDWLAVPLLEDDIRDIMMYGYHEPYFVREEIGLKMLRKKGGKCIWCKKDSEEVVWISRQY